MCARVPARLTERDAAADPKFVNFKVPAVFEDRAVAIPWTDFVVLNSKTGVSRVTIQRRADTDT